jgi:DNA-binding MarR family transcriptional regulator
MKNSSTTLLNNIDPQSCINARVRKLSRIITNIYEKEFRAFDVRSSQVSILMMVGKKGIVNQKEVADFLFIDQSTMSRDIAKLKERNLIRSSTGSDARYNNLELTGKGHSLLNEIIPVWKNLQNEIEQICCSFSLKPIDKITDAIKSYFKK